METMRFTLLILACAVQSAVCWYPWVPPPPPPPPSTPPPPINPFEELKSFLPHIFFPHLAHHHPHHEHWEFPTTTAAPPTESPFYNYNYEVNSPLTGDIKSHTEERDGEVVRGEYSLLDADGSIRTVKYFADASGFNADVFKIDPATTPPTLGDGLVPWHLHFHPLLEHIHLPETREDKGEKLSAEKVEAVEKVEITTQKPQK